MSKKSRAFLVIFSLLLGGLVYVGFNLSTIQAIIVVLLVIILGEVVLWVVHRVTSSNNEVLSKLKSLQHQQQEDRKDIMRRVTNEVTKARRITYSQMESLSVINKLIKSPVPLPTMGGWAIAADSAVILARLVKEGRFKKLLDLGSGTSSIIMGHILAQENVKGAKVLSIDHEEAFAQGTEANLREHGLTKIVSVLVAPLVEQKVGGEQYLWYDLAGHAPSDIDFVFVDGPPGKLQPRSRYPALPVLYDKLSKSAVIMVDDYDREDERWMVKEWLRLYPEFTLEELHTEKGVAILRR